MHSPAAPPPRTRLPGSCFVTGMAAQDDEGAAALALVHGLRQIGLCTAAMTPMAVDATERHGRWTSSQLTRLGQAGSFGLPGSALSPYILPQALNPEQAAIAAGLHFDCTAVVETYEVLATWADAVVVQGVGGLGVTLGPALQVHDVAARLGLPLVLALHPDVQAPERARQVQGLMQQRDLRLAGWVATTTSGAPDPALLLLLQTTLGQPPWGVVDAQRQELSQCPLDLELLSLALGLEQGPRTVQAPPPHVRQRPVASCSKPGNPH